MPTDRIAVRIETPYGNGSSLSLSARVFVPEPYAPGKHPIALFCFPGGGMTQDYFDLHGHSFAHALTQSGLIVVTFDHAGIGESQAPPDGFALTARKLAELGAAAATEMAKRLRQGTLSPNLPPLAKLRMIGVGHSMGAMLVTLQQAAYRPYLALALLGFSTRGLPEVLTPAEQDEAKHATRNDAYYVNLARQRFGDQAYASFPARQEGLDALKAASAPLLTVAAMQSMLPNNIAPEAATIDVPLFLAVGDRDITGRPEAIAPRFVSAPSTHLLVLENTGHHLFISAAANTLYADLAAWAQKIQPPS